MGKNATLSGLFIPALLASTAVIAVSSCGKVDNYDFDPNAALLAQQGPKQGQNIFKPTLQPVKVDMLFIVDNSGSMEGEQNILANAFAQFIDQFVKKDIDFHIGVLTTDVFNEGDATYWGSSLQGYSNPSMGCLLSRTGGERFLASTSSNLVSKFQDNIRVGIKGSGREQGLQSLSEAFKSTRLDSKSGCNRGFLRSDALLWTGVVSDENEDMQNDETPTQRVDRIMALLNQLKSGGSRGWKTDFIVDTQVAKPSQPITYPLPKGVNGYPEVYLAAAEAMKGRKINVQQDFSQSLVSVGSDIIRQAESEFKLSHVPTPGTLTVQMNGKLLMEGNANGYVYHSSRNTIELKGAALTQSPGSQIVVDYVYQ